MIVSTKGRYALRMMLDMARNQMQSEKYSRMVVYLTLPEEGEEVVYENLRLVVEKVERNRIETIHIYQMSEEE